MWKSVSRVPIQGYSYSLDRDVGLGSHLMLAAIVELALVLYGMGCIGRGGMDFCPYTTYGSDVNFQGHGRGETHTAKGPLADEWSCASEGAKLTYARTPLPLSGAIRTQCVPYEEGCVYVDSPACCKVRRGVHLAGSGVGVPASLA